jgi:hypothetical protein
VSENILKDSKGSVNLPQSRTPKFTPQKKYSSPTSWLTPVGNSTFTKKYQINRDSEDSQKLKATTSKTEMKDLRIKAQIEEKPKQAQLSETDIAPFFEKPSELEPAKFVKNFGNKSVNNSVSESKDDKEILGRLTDRISPILDILKENQLMSHQSFDFDKDATSIKLKNCIDKPLKHKTPRPSVKYEIFLEDTTNKVDSSRLFQKSGFEPKTAEWGVDPAD